MVNGIGSSGGGGLAKQAIEAALKRSQDASKRMAGLADAAAGGNSGVSASAPDPNSFAGKVAKSINEISESNRGVDELPEALATGKITDIHEVAAQLKQAELSLKFALEVRNKFIDAYQEVMRMSV